MIADAEHEAAEVAVDLVDATAGVTEAAKTIQQGQYMIADSAFAVPDLKIEAAAVFAAFVAEVDALLNFDETVLTVELVKAAGTVPTYHFVALTAEVIAVLVSETPVVYARKTAENLADAETASLLKMLQDMDSWKTQPSGSDHCLLAAAAVVELESSRS